MPTLCLCLEGGGCCCARRGLVFDSASGIQTVPPQCLHQSREVRFNAYPLPGGWRLLLCASRSCLNSASEKRQYLPSAFAWRHCLARGADTHLQPSTSCPITGCTCARP